MKNFNQPLATVLSTLILVLGFLFAVKTGGAERQKTMRL